MIPVRGREWWSEDSPNLSVMPEYSLVGIRGSEGFVRPLSFSSTIRGLYNRIMNSPTFKQVKGRRHGVILKRC
jgi:hypothetical protein